MEYEHLLTRAGNTWSIDEAQAVFDGVIKNPGRFRTLLRIARSVCFKYKLTDNATFEDIVAESVYAAFRSRATYDPTVGHFDNWLNKIVIRTANAKCKGIMKEESLRKTWVEDTSSARGADNLGDMLRSIDTTQSIDRAFGLLSPDFRDIIERRIIKQHSYKEIAVELGISHEAARRRGSRAIQALATILNRQEQGDE